MSEDMKYGEEGYKEMHDVLPYYEQSMHEAFPSPDYASETYKQVNVSKKSDSERKPIRDRFPGMDR